MRKFLILLLLVLVPASFTSCSRGHRGHAGIGSDGVDGTDGTDGIDGSNGLNGLGFDYVRGITGAELCDSFLVIPANLVLPAGILNLAPPINPRKLQGATLTFGTEVLSFRYYLAEVMAGELCVVERDYESEEEEVLGQIVVAEDGWLAIVPLGTLQVTALDPGVLEQGVLVTLELYDENEEEEAEDDGCVLLKFNRRHLSFGHDVRINFNREDD